LLHFDGTITLGNILTIITGLTAFLAFYSKMVRLFAILTEYPPHRHNGDVVIYPRGMRPEDPAR
jgi:hypothetical protein